MQVGKICPFYIRIHFAVAWTFAHFQTLAHHKYRGRLFLSCLFLFMLPTSPRFRNVKKWT